MTDFGSLLQSAVTLAAFLVGISAFLPKGLEDEWFAYFLFLVPSPVLFLITAALAAYDNYLALPFFAGSIGVLLVLFVGLGIWSSLEKHAEQQIKERVRTRNPRLSRLLTSSS